MVDGASDVGGTLGANSWLAALFSYTDDDLAVIRKFWQPSEAWLDQYRRLFAADSGEVELDGHQQDVEEALAFLHSGSATFDGIASTFLRRHSSSAGKATVTMQKLYLEKVESLALELSALIQDVSVKGTPADLFALARHRLNMDEAFKIEIELITDLSVIASLAKFRLRNRTLPSEEAVHGITGKTTLDRFKFAYAALKFYEDSTGKTATAWINDTPEGQRASEAISYLMAVMNPVLSSIGLPMISADSARKEIQEAKKAKNSGLDPSLPYFGQRFYSE